MNRQPRWPAWLLLAALGLHALNLARTTSVAELLWSCHVATTIMAIGILLRARVAVATALLFHLSIGLPAWLVEIVVTRGTFGAAKIDPALAVTSILVHLLPALVGAMWMRRDGFRLTWPEILFAWLIQAALIPLSRPFTPPELNINLAHGVWPAMSHAFSRTWLFQAAACAACAGSVLLVATIVNLFAPRTSSGA